MTTASTSTPTSAAVLTETDILAGLAAVLEEVAGTPVDKVVPKARFDFDLDVDSLSMVEVVVACEEKFGIRIPDEVMEDLQTVGDAVALIVAATSA